MVTTIDRFHALYSFYELWNFFGYLAMATVQPITEIVTVLHTLAKAYNYEPG
jgi:hypothetical protein